MSFSCLSFVGLFVPFYAIPNTRSTFFFFKLHRRHIIFRVKNLEKLPFRDQNMMIHQLKAGIYDYHHVALHVDVVIGPRETFFSSFLFLFLFLFLFFSSFLSYVKCKQMMSVKSKTIIMDCERIYFASTRTYA